MDRLLAAPASAVIANNGHLGLVPGSSSFQSARTCSGPRLPSRLERRKSELLRQIEPVGIVFLNNIELPLPRPALDRLFASDRDLDVVVSLKPDETLDVMLGCIAAESLLSVLVNSRQKVRGDAPVKCASIAIGQQIDAGLESSHRPQTIRSLGPEQVRADWKVGPIPGTSSGRDERPASANARPQRPRAPDLFRGKGAAARTSGRMAARKAKDLSSPAGAAGCAHPRPCRRRAS